MMKVPFWSPARDFKKRESEYANAFLTCGRAGNWILRDDVKAFEANFAETVGTKYAVAVASGTDALFLTLKAIGIRPDEEVIIPSYTFRATVEAAHHAGAKVVLADLHEDWRKYKTEKTKVIIPAHIAGDTLNWHVEPHEDVFMLEDSCQAITAKPLTGVAAAYSFYPAKILGCFGDGGAVATNDADLYEMLQMMRNHYKGNWGPFGYNSRLDNLQAAILNIKLKYLEDDIDARKKVALYYDEHLKGVVGIPLPRKVYQDYIIYCKHEMDRDYLKRFLETRGIETLDNGYPFPEVLLKGKDTLRYESVSLRIPCNPDLTKDEIRYVADTIREFYNK